MHALLLEVAGKQDYIFATNKLREAVGASRLVAVSTTGWLDEAIGRVDDALVERVVMVSGRALLTIRAEDAGREQQVCRALLREVTTRALRKAEPGAGSGAPGLLVAGVFLGLAGDELGGDDVRRLEAALEELRTRGVPAEARSPRLPVVAACASSDGPAAVLLDDVGGPVRLSAASLAKRAYNHDGRDSIGERLPDGVELVEAGALEEALGDGVAWLGVVHIDGNRMGDLVRRLEGIPGSYAQNYRRFSQELDECTTAALGEAAVWLREHRPAGQPLPLVPLVASGDDLTVLIDGRYALPFAVTYLRAFERLSGTGFLAEAAAATGRGDRLTAAAGVAVVKPHFPFSVAYQLCEQACRSAKVLSRRASVSAIDWHVHYDSVGRELDQVRRALRNDGFDYLRRPYAVLAEGAQAPPDLRGRDWAALAGAVCAAPVLPHPESGDALPASQLHRLRETLVQRGPAAASALFDMLARRPELAMLRQLGETLFEQVPTADGAGSIGSTLLMDFLDGRFVAPAEVR